MDGWMDGWMVVWVGGWMDGCVGGWMDGWLGGWLAGMFEWGCLSWKMDGFDWIDGYSHIYMQSMFTFPLLFQSVQARSEKIAEDEKRCLVLAEAAQRDLDEAIPALEEAVKVHYNSMVIKVALR